MTFVRCQQLSRYFLSKEEACLFANGWKGDMPHTKLDAISAVDSETLSQHGGLTLDVDVEYPAKPEHFVWSTGSSPWGRGERSCHVPLYHTEHKSVYH